MKHNNYWMNIWGDGYFHTNTNGELIVTPNKDDKKINLFSLVKSLVKRGIEPPILFRFDGIVRNKIHELYKAFENAIIEYGYKNIYKWAYPIKVNQQKHIIDVITKENKNYPIGLEVGSKPELIAVLASSVNNEGESLLLCNGYKDEKYIELALLSQKIGSKTIIIIEQPYELPLVLKIADRLKIKPNIGIRFKPYSKGSGKWASSGGDLAKFGLNAHEINAAIKYLKKEKKENYLKLLHFHIGSQVTSILPLKKAFSEAARMYVEIAKLCPSMTYLDVGGGLAIDYDGTQTTDDCSMNYSLEQYARDVVYSIGTMCDNENIDHPIIITESGRAVVAHHCILVTEVIDVSPTLDEIDKLEKPPTDSDILQEIWEIYSSINSDNLMESLHDSLFIKKNAAIQFTDGNISLAERAYIENGVRRILAKLVNIANKQKFVPEEILKLKEELLDIYFCNFSIFQSLPDTWAIEQHFPIMPIHKLHTEPTRRASIVDLTCDSDGKINNYVHPKKIKKSINLHEFTGEPYYLGTFLVGAYQETLGGLHNLFGDTNAVHVDIDSEGRYEVKNLIEGDSIKEVLHYMQYNLNELTDRLHVIIEKALKKNLLTFEDSAKFMQFFKKALESYTYLVV